MSVSDILMPVLRIFFGKTISRGKDGAFCETHYPIILLMYCKAYSVSDCDSEKWR